MSEVDTTEHTDVYMTIGQNEETGYYHGLIYRNYKTPSGMDRWLLALSTKQGFETERAAGEFMNQEFTDLPPIKIDALSTENVFLNLPHLLAGTEIQLMTYNCKSKDPAPRDCLPIINVFCAGKKTDTQLTSKQLEMLQRLKRIEFDSTSGEDPNLSCVYSTFFVAQRAAAVSAIANELEATLNTMSDRQGLVPVIPEGWTERVKVAIASENDKEIVACALQIIKAHSQYSAGWDHMQWLHDLRQATAGLKAS